MSGVLKLRRIVPVLMLGLAASTAAARGEPTPARLEVVDSKPVVVGSEVTFRSEILAAEVSMNVYVPESFELASDEHTYPVIFASGAHGRQFFSTLAGIVKHLGDRERIPESIVVSLDDLGDLPDIYTNGMWSREKIEGSGDPEKSLRHLREEVIPYLEERYRANDYRTIVGVSGSSLFPIHTFIQAPELFDAHVLIAAADTIGMGYRSGESFIGAFEAALAATPQRRGRLYVGVAESDLEDRDDYRANLDELSSRLKRFAGLDLRVEVVPNSDHYSVFIKAMLSAFDQSFPHERWSSRYRELVAQPGDALRNIDRYYGELSRDYGFKILPRAERWNNVNCLRFMIRHLVQAGRAEEAVAVAERRVEYRPRSASSFSGLADAYEAVGQAAAAVAALERARDLARAGGDETAGYEERIRGLQEHPEEEE